MRPTTVARSLLLRQLLHILQAAHQVLQLAAFGGQRRPRVRLLGAAKAGNQGGIALLGFDASPFAFAVAFDAQGVHEADAIARLMQAESQRIAVGAGGFQTDMQLAHRLGGQPGEQTLMTGRGIVIALVFGLLAGRHALEPGIDFGFGDVDAQHTVYRDGWGYQGHTVVSFRSEYDTLCRSGGTHRQRSTLCIQAWSLKGGLRYCSICPVADSTTRSHVRNRRDALGQGQISRGAASSSQEIVPDTISFDKLIIQGTGGLVPNTSHLRTKGGKRRQESSNLAYCQKVT